MTAKVAYIDTDAAAFPPEDETFIAAVERLCGARAAARVLVELGGCRFNVPVADGAKSRLGKVLSPSQLSKVVHLWGGAKVVIPTGRTQAVRLMILGGQSAVAISRQLRCSRRYVMYVRAEMKAQGLTIPTPRSTVSNDQDEAR